MTLMVVCLVMAACLLWLYSLIVRPKSSAERHLSFMVFSIHTSCRIDPNRLKDWDYKTCQRGIMTAIVINISAHENILGSKSVNLMITVDVTQRLSGSKPAHEKPFQFWVVFFFFQFCFLLSSPVLLDPRLPAPRLHLLSERRPRQQRGALGLRSRLPPHRERHSHLPPHITRLPRVGLSCTCMSRCDCSLTSQYDTLRRPFKGRSVLSNDFLPLKCLMYVPLTKYAKITHLQLMI